MDLAVKLILLLFNKVLFSNKSPSITSVVLGNAFFSFLVKIVDRQNLVFVLVLTFELIRITFLLRLHNTVGYF